MIHIAFVEKAIIKHLYYLAMHEILLRFTSFQTLFKVDVYFWLMRKESDIQKPEGCHIVQSQTTSRYWFFTAAVSLGTRKVKLSIEANGWIE